MIDEKTTGNLSEFYRESFCNEIFGPKASYLYIGNLMKYLQIRIGSTGDRGKLRGRRVVENFV
jgi:hypothetical protein